MNASELARMYPLALATFREAEGESLLGKMLVAQVIENRVQDPRWPENYVSVITQKLQFSAFNPGDATSIKWPREGAPNWNAWLDSVAAAQVVLDAPSKLTEANHYHAKSVRPEWANDDKIVAREGNHIFYKL